MSREMAFRAVEPSGALAIGMEPDALVERLPPRIELSVVSSPYRCVVSGPDAALVRFAEELAAQGTPVHRLDVISAVHGRFGRWVGRWLAEHGCRHLFLIGRTGASSDPAAAAGPEHARRAEALAAMRTAGAQVTVVQANLTDRLSIFCTLDEAHRAGTGVVTIFHLAGAPNAVSAGSPLDHLVMSGLRSALDEQWAPKVAGAQTLLSWTRLHPEARCVTFSSNAALLGGPGLAAYAAANAALDALAVQAGDRERLNWCSIGWDG